MTSALNNESQKLFMCVTGKRQGMRAVNHTPIQQYLFSSPEAKVSLIKYARERASVSRALVLPQ